MVKICKECQNRVGTGTKIGTVDKRKSEEKDQ
jgi:hypothetical protein